MIWKVGHWVLYELKPRDVKRQFFACEQLLQRYKRKCFLHQIVTGDEKWVHYDNPKRQAMYGSMQHGLADQHFSNYEEVKNWIDSWIVEKPAEFFKKGIRELPEKLKKVIARQ